MRIEPFLYENALLYFKDFELHLETLVICLLRYLQLLLYQKCCGTLFTFDEDDVHESNFMPWEAEYFH